MTLELPDSSPVQPGASAAPVKNPSPRALITKACETNDIIELSRALKACSSNDANKDQELLSWCLHSAVYHGQPDIVRYLLEQEGAQLDSVPPIMVSVSPSIPLLQLLFDHGWDINQSPAGGIGGGKTLLQMVCGNEALVHWCLDHGATVEDPHPDPYKCPALLEIVASIGTVDIFKLLQSRGAQLGARTLHRAAGAAAHFNGDDKALPVRMAMVEYLVDNLGLDVNMMDTDGQMPNHWGTPLCYAAQPAHGGEDVVRFLLDRGADPFIKDCWGIHDAFGVAKHSRNAQISDLLSTWMVQKGQKE